MTRPHNFTLIRNTVQMDQKRKKMIQRWECKGCDSIVAYDVRLKQHEVNTLCAAKFDCIPAKVFDKN